MKVGGPAASSGAAPVGARRIAGPGDGFTGAGPATSARAAAPSASAGPAGLVGGLDALLALQDIGGPLERRRRALARGGRVLDGLDRVQLALLEGGDTGEALGALSRSAAEARERGDDASLDGVLDEIDLRAAVEMAKAETRRAA